MPQDYKLFKSVQIYWPLASPKKNLNSPLRELRIAPSFLSPQTLGVAALTATISLFTQAGLLTPGSFYSQRLPSPFIEPVASCWFRPRSQRRDRDGFSPSSLLTQRGLQL